MKALFVTPVKSASGEIITALHMGERLFSHGWNVLFLSSIFGGSFLEKQFPNKVQLLAEDDGERNRIIWETTVQEFRPDIIIFADYPHFFCNNTTPPLANVDEWAHRLETESACLVTLDHAGFAQRPNGMFIGPPHLSFYYVEWPAIPERMHILLPCPMNEPSLVAGLKGQPFRYWDVPLSIEDQQRRAVRNLYLRSEDEYLIFHPVPKWTWEIVRRFGLPYYQFLPGILDYYLADVTKPVTVVSLNNGHLLEQPKDSRIRFLNVPNLPKDEYEALLFASDLMITENNASITLGKAICGLLPCIVLHNSYTYRQLLERMKGPLRQVVKAMEAIRSGAVFPYDSFGGGTEEIERLGIYRDNSITRAFKELEIYGEEETRDALVRLLTDEKTRDALRVEQQVYVNNVQKLETAETILKRLVESKELSR